MRWWSKLSRAAPIPLVAMLLGATAVMVSREREPSTVLLSSVGAPPVITLAWHAVGKDVEPWSALGLGTQVRRALNARGIVVIDDTMSHSLAPGGGLEVLTALGRQTDATYVLAGTIGRNGERSEIGMQLVRVQDGVAVWASTFWRDPGDLDSLASDLAGAVAQVLKAETSPGGEPP